MTDLTGPQLTALTALLSGKSVPDAASAAGVDPTTVRRWLRTDDGFIEELAAGRREVLWAAMDVTMGAARTAAETVIGIMKNTRTRPHVRLMAAKIVLEQLTRWLELQDFDRRLRKLERGDDATE